ncbi:hypothetical protein POM88_040071 [Heracleum sosnowskyi]|uniref:Uncharacterized protein n=1 Tax=Heracleum sosnowskyi TaxID=360622 RepID=A0AAD8HEB0_9APIA|nr:hypothetical protein POM88_040071 [Heracleum sosnowskyi]
MAETILVDVASGLVSKLVSLATDEVILAWNVQEDLESLRERLELIDKLLSDAAIKKLTMSTVQHWFNNLEAVAHVANIFLDELAYEVTRQKVENHHKVRNFFVPSKNSMLHHFKMAHKIKSIQASFDKIFKLGSDLGIQPVARSNVIVQSVETSKNAPYEDKSLIFGRDKDISSLVEMVCKNYEEDLQVIAVKGMGGQGKSTLARMVNKADNVINMFRERIFVTVSCDFDFMKILNEMVESLTSKPSMLIKF